MTESTQSVQLKIKVSKLNSTIGNNSRLKKLGFVLHGVDTGFIYWRCPANWSSDDLKFVEWEVDN